MRFDRTVNLGHVLVLAGLLLNAGVMVVQQIRAQHALEVSITDHDRRLRAAEASIEELRRTQVLLERNLSVLTALFERERKGG